MLKEIPETPVAFEGKIPALRITVSELVNTLKTLDGCEITAVSNKARFEELADIEKNPGRFAGNPRVEVKSQLDERSPPTVSIVFGNGKTTITPDYGFRDNNDASNLARRIHGELLPFANSIEYYVRWVARIITYLSFFGGVFYLSVWLLDTIKEAPPEEQLSERLGQILLWGFNGSLWTGMLLDRRKPVKYSPRETWWQRHSETLITTTVGSIISGLIVYYLTKD